MEVSDVLTYIVDVLSRYNLVPILVAVAVLVAVYVIVSKVLRMFRSRGVISRGTEETLRFTSLAVIALVVFAIAISFFLQIHILAAAFIALFLMFIGMIMYSVRSYVENTISYALFMSSNIVRDGDIVEVVVGDKTYRGRINIAEGGYAVIDATEGRVYIPYSALVKSVIVKTTHHILRFRLKLRGQNIDLARAVNEVKNIISEIKVLNRETISVMPVKVDSEEIHLNVSVELLNPRNIYECSETLTKLLSMRLPYSFSIEFL